MTAAMLFVLVVQPGGEHASLVMINDIVQAIAPVIAAVVCFAAARRSSPGGWRAGWWLLGLSALSWCAGQIVWTWYEMVRGIEAPFPSAADLGYLGPVPLGSPPSSRSRSTPARWFRAIVDGLILALGVLQVSWAAVLGPTFRNGDGSILEQVIALAYPATDTAVLVVLLVTLTRGRQGGGRPSGRGRRAGRARHRRRLVRLPCGERLLRLGRDHRHRLDLRLPADRAARTRSSPTIRPRAPAGGRPPRRLHAMLPFVSVLALVAVIAVRTPGRRSTGFLLWNAIATALLVVARQLVVIAENAGPTRSLESTVRELGCRRPTTGSPA